MVNNENYHELVEALKERFPEGTVKTRNDNDRVYIPHQAYLNRLERVLSGQWSRETRELEINVTDKFVKAIVRVQIGPYYRDGSAIAEITVQGLSNAENRAKSAAFVDALDSWEMGWRDLAPYNNDWGKNPALSHLLTSTPLPSGASPEGDPLLKTDHRCIGPGCNKLLTYEEIDVLKRIPNFNFQKMKYCLQHLPAAFLRRLENVADTLPADYQERLYLELDRKKKS